MKAILLILICIAGIIIGLIVFSAKHPHSAKGKTLKSNMFSDVQSIYKPFVLESRVKICILFSPNCEFCFNEFLDLSKNIEYFQNVQLIFVTPADSLSAVNYFNSLMLSGISSYYLLIDSEKTLKNIFPEYRFPTTCIIGVNNQIIKSIRGQTNAKEILAVLNNDK